MGDERGHPHFLGTGEWVPHPILGTGEWVAPSIPASQPRRAFQSCTNSERLHSGRGGVAESKIQHGSGVNVSLASLGRYARTCERYHGLFSPGSRPTGSSQTLSASPTGLRARWACGLMVLGATKSRTTLVMGGVPVRWVPLVAQKSEMAVRADGLPMATSLS